MQTTSFRVRARDQGRALDIHTLLVSKPRKMLLVLREHRRLAGGDVAIVGGFDLVFQCHDGNIWQGLEVASVVGWCSGMVSRGVVTKETWR